MEQEQEIYWTGCNAQHPYKSHCIAWNDEPANVVDGLIVEAQQITGATKVFLRNDRRILHWEEDSHSCSLYAREPGEEMDIT